MLYTDPWLSTTGPQSLQSFRKVNVHVGAHTSSPCSVPGFSCPTQPIGTIFSWLRQKQQGGRYVCMYVLDTRPLHLPCRRHPQKQQNKKPLGCRGKKVGDSCYRLSILQIMDCSKPSPYCFFPYYSGTGGS